MNERRDVTHDNRSDEATGGPTATTVDPTDADDRIDGDGGGEGQVDGDGEVDGDGDDEKSWWATTWPIDTSRTFQIIGSGVALVAVLALIGAVAYRWTNPNPITDADRDVSEWLVDQRNSFWNDAAHWGSFISDTSTKIVLTLAVVGYALWKWRRWHEAVLIGVSLIFEATVFIVTSTIVGRPRPDIERLASSPVDTSFPSGHVAAAACYFAFTVVVLWHARSTWARVLAIGFGVAATGIVGWARAYEGMHFLTDVVVGAILGIVSVFLCVRILGAPHDAVLTPLGEERNPDRRPDHATAA